MATEINLQNDDITVNSVSGNGSGLTSLNASNISSGTLSSARLSFSILDEDAMTSNSATDVPSQQSVKSYVDTQIAGVGGGGGATLEAAKAFMSANSAVNNTTAYSQINVFPATGGLVLNQGSFTSSASGIVVPSSGVYIVGANMLYNSTVVRAAPEYRFSINGTGQPEESVSSYIRATSGHNESSSSLTTLYNLVAGDEIGLQFRRQAGAGTVNLETGSHVFIYRVA